MNSRDGPGLRSWDLALCPNLPKEVAVEIRCGTKSGFNLKLFQLVGSGGGGLVHRHVN